MIHAWQRVTKKMNRNVVKEDSVAYRLSLVLIDTGPGILISALTNITADAVGSLTGFTFLKKILINFKDHRKLLYYVLEIWHRFLWISFIKLHFIRP